IHLKTIPDADEKLIEQAGRYADRMSINIELPREQSLAKLAPEKNVRAIRAAMGKLRLKIDEAKKEKKAPRFSPAGQGTQMIIGGDGKMEKKILETSPTLHASYRLNRVYSSASSPIPDASRALPLQAPPLGREHRLYQADWLLRFYGFNVEEIATASKEGML